VVQAIIALGSNVGDRLANLRLAVDLLSKQIEIVKTSHVYETEPMYVENQPAFLNAALISRTDLSPRDLLALLKSLEQEIGRQARQICGPREIDLDLIAYGALSYRYMDGKQTRLLIPHPRIPERRFVLQPVLDVAPKFNLPGLGIVEELLRQTDGQSESVRKVEDAILPIQRHG